MSPFRLKTRRRSLRCTSSTPAEVSLQKNPNPPRHSQRVGRGKAPLSAGPNAGALGVAEKQKLRASDYPLIARILQGPCEQVSKVFLMEKDQVEEVTYDVSLPARDVRRFWMGAGCSRGRKTWRGDVFMLGMQELLCFSPVSPRENSPFHGKKLVLCLKSSFKLQVRAKGPSPVLPSQI